MKQIEYIAVMNAIEKVECLEIGNCRGYCKVNPQDRERREKERDIVLGTLMNLRFVMQREIGKYVEEGEL